MPNLSAHEKRTIRLAVVAIAIYLGLFYGVKSWRWAEARRDKYQRLVAEAQALQAEVKSYENKLELAQKLKDRFQIQPARLTKATLVAEASAAIQKAAQTGAIQLGPIRESPGRPSAKELTSMQLEGFGPVPAVMAFLHRVGTLGFPVIIDSVQVNLDPAKPGMIKISLTLVVLDFEQWKNPEARNV